LCILPHLLAAPSLKIREQPVVNSIERTDHPISFLEAQLMPFPRPV
jgi:hypothetical protein